MSEPLDRCARRIARAMTDASTNSAPTSISLVDEDARDGLEAELRWLETNVAAYFDQGGPDPLTDVAARIRRLVAALSRSITTQPISYDEVCKRGLTDEAFAHIDCGMVRSITTADAGQEGAWRARWLRLLERTTERGWGPTLLSAMVDIEVEIPARTPSESTGTDAGEEFDTMEDEIFDWLPDYAKTITRKRQLSEIVARWRPSTPERTGEPDAEGDLTAIAETVVAKVLHLKHEGESREMMVSRTRGILRDALPLAKRTIPAPQEDAR